VPPQPEYSNVVNDEATGLSKMSPVGEIPEMIFRFGKKIKDTNGFSYAAVSPANKYVLAEIITTLAAAYSPAVFV